MTLPEFNLPSINFPKFGFRFKNRENKPYIFDEIRKKFILLTPEEWIRQNTIKWLVEHKKYSKSLINVEKEIVLYNTKKRYDIVVFNPNGSLFLLVECKAKNIEITQNTFDQIAQYNLALQANFLMVTNGINHYFCKLDYQKKEYQFLVDLPSMK